jgi:hypothetical protein
MQQVSEDAMAALTHPICILKVSFAGQRVSEYARKHPIRSFVVDDSYGGRVEHALTRTATTSTKRIVERLGLGPTRGDSTTLMVRQRR